MYYLDLKLLESTDYSIGKYGIIRWQYLKEQHQALYVDLLLSGELNQYLHGVDEECYVSMEVLIRQLKGKWG